VKIIPADSTVRKPITVDMKEVLQKGDTSKLPKLHPGDTIYVPKIEVETGKAVAPAPSPEGMKKEEPFITEEQKVGFVINVMGAVAKPGSFTSYEELSLPQALLLAGSVTDNTALKDVRVIRGQENKVIHVDFDKYLLEGDASILPRLYSGDTIYVPPLTPDKMRDVSILITGEVLKPGSYATLKSMDILDVISMAGGLSPNADPERIMIRKESPGEYQEKIVNIEEFLSGVGGSTPPVMVEPGYRIYVPAKRGSATKVAIAARGVVGFIADLIPIYGLYRLIRG